ncbi:MAG: insulinase family protein [Kofleriaceae bacterium]|nr:insulinase family protein [Kofleriaceae bacterium]
MPRQSRHGYDRVAAGLAALLWAAPASAHQLTPTTVNEVTTYRLDNGAAVVVAPNAASKLVAVQAWIGAGAADEPAAAGGVAHAVEHMLFKGSNSYQVGELTRAVAAIGGEINAWTAFDHTVLHAVAPAAQVATLLDGVADTLTTPLMSAEAFAVEQHVILDELRHSVEDPLRLATHSMFATAFTHHPYRRPVIGTAQSIAGLSVRDAVDYFRQWYVGANLALVITGGVDPAAVMRECTRRFRAMPAGHVVRRRAAEPAQTGPRVSVHHADIDQAYVALGFRAPSLRHRDFAALDVAALVLGQRDGARLTRRLRSEISAATSAYAQLHATKDPGLFAITATTEPGHVGRVVAGIVEQLVGLATELHHDELEIAKIAIEADRTRQLETVFGHARTLGWNTIMTGDADFHHGYLDRVRRLRKDDVAAAVRLHLTPDQVSVAAVLPEGHARASAALPKQVQRALTRLAGAAASANTGRKSSGAARSATTASTQRLDEKRVVLANGVVLLVRRDSSVAVVAMRAVWRGGARLESDANNGITTLLARLLTQGCGGMKQANVARKFEQLGGGLVGVAGRNSLSLAGEFLATTWREGFALMAQCAMQPRFDHGDVATAREALVADLVHAEQQPGQVAYRNFATTLFGSHPYRLDVAGNASAMARLSRPTVINFFRDTYATAPMTIALVGDIDIDEAVTLASKLFGGGKRVEPPTVAPVRVPVLPVVTPSGSRRNGRRPVPVVVKPPPVVPALAAPREIYAYQQRESAHLVVGFAGTRTTAADRFTVEVMVAALAGQSGRLFAELRERSGLVYRVSAHSIEGVDPGFIAIALSCKPAQVDSAIEKIRSELGKLVSEGVTGEELARIKQSLIGMHAVHLQRRAAVASAMAFHEAYGLRWTDWQIYDDAIAAVTREQVQAAARTYLDWNHSIISVVRPPTASPGADRRINGKPRSKIAASKRGR